MGSDEIRKKYIEFFKAPPRNHIEIEPSPLVLENDPTTLFTSAGMQPLVSYLKGEPHPKGKRLVDIQPSFRTVDIDEVGDNRHLTFFEMLGNWSLGDYFKKEQLEWCLEFFEKELGLAKDKLWVSVFEGTKEVPKDSKSVEIWKSLGIAESRIFYYGAKENWWSRSGPPESMPSAEIGGPDSEVFFEFDLSHNPKFGKDCHPNCQCGRFIEIGNSVFIQYQKNEDGTLSELPQKNVDFGGGLERIAAALGNNPDIFDIDLFSGAKKILEKVDLVKTEESERSIRIILDHIRAAFFITADGVEPSNKEQGYVARRLIRRAALHSKIANIDLDSSLPLVLHEFSNIYKSSYPEVSEKKGQILTVITEELGRFEKTLITGMKKIAMKKRGTAISGEELFDYYQTYGYPPELVIELAKNKDLEVDLEGFEDAKKVHQEKSRTASVGMFKGGLLDTSKEVVRLHTATHLIHAALRKVLGEHVSQKGSNITAERLRFDFSHPQKLSEAEVKKVEDLVNAQIKKDLSVSFEEKSRDEALKDGALAFFGEKYGEKVKVYTIGNPSAGSGPPFSREVCGGPHVAHTGEIGRVRIVKQEKLGRGVVRIYATAG